MIRFIASYVERLDDVYRDRPYFSRLKVRLLAGIVTLMAVFAPINVAKNIWAHAPNMGVRLVMNGILAVTALFSLRSLFRGKLERAGAGLVLVVLCACHVIILIGPTIGPTYFEPLSAGIQLLAYDLVFLLFALIFVTRRLAFAAGLMMVLGLILFHQTALQPPIAGSPAFAADTLLRDGLIALGFVFCLGLTLMHMIESAHWRSEEALRETRQMNENLERLVTDRTRELEVVLGMAQEASRAKSEFLANMSHEIRTPLNGIIASSDLLMRSSNLPEEAGAHATLISESGDLLLNLIGDILDFSKIEAGQLALEQHPFELAPTVTGAVALIATKASLGSLRLETKVADDLPKYLEGDAYRLRQVLLNLLSNAVKFTPAGGLIQIAVTSSAPGSDPMPVRFEVRDEGIGMNEAALKTIFDRFTQADSSTTRRYGGTGLGLAISSRLVQMMGGKLEVESTLGKGSVFRFTLQLPPTEEIPDGVASLDRLEMPLHLQVLVVEDNSVNQKILGAQLAQLGCHYVIVINGEEALLALQQEPLPDVVLMDCHMPKLDGWETTRRIRSWADDAQETRRKAAALPIIALTAAAMAEERERCLQAGMNDFVAKPAKLADLHRVLVKVRS